MFTRLRQDTFSTALLRVLILLLIVITFGFIAAAFDLWGITMSTSAGVLVGGIAVLAAALAFRNAQLKSLEDSGDGNGDGTGTGSGNGDGDEPPPSRFTDER